MNEVIEWLRSPEGEQWSHNYMAGFNNDGGNPARHSKGIFADVKWDHECFYNPETKKYASCYPTAFPFSWTDNQIRADIAKYGMNGLPKELA